MFARTQRLTLRPGWIEDAPALEAAIAFPEVAFKLSRLPWPYTRAHAEQWLARTVPHDEVTLLVFAHEPPALRLIGGVGIHPTETGRELGYWLTPSAWGRGYATEAGRAILGIARHAIGLRRLEAGHFVDNPASGRVLTKLGFRPTGQIAQRPCIALGAARASVEMALDLDEGETGDDKPARLAA